MKSTLLPPLSPTRSTANDPSVVLRRHFKLENLHKEDVVKGPAMIIDDTRTIVLDPGAEGVHCSIYLARKKQD
jgi:hypothetical protein